MAKPTTPSSLSTQLPPARAILLAVQLQRQTDRDVKVSLDELNHLTGGLEMSTVARVVQKRPETSATLVVGAGKLDELRELISEHTQGDDDTPLVIYDGELTPGQQRNLSTELNAEVFDRTEVILRVFARRARTRTAQLEVELARLNYEAPRARDDSSLDRQSGGGGRGGRGNSNLQLLKQNTRRRIAELRRDLDHESSQRHTRRSRREGTPIVTLVGYTNAGKSSLMRALTGADTLVENQLFATLGTTVRALAGKGPRTLVADTVGFIRNLPNHLLASFRTTLDEALDADLLLHVVDASDPEWQAQLEVTVDVLAEVGASQIPALVVFNKMDQVDEKAHEELLNQQPNAICISAHSTTDVARLTDAVIARLEADYTEVALSVPFSAGKLLGDIHARARVLSQTYTSDGSIMQVRARSQLIASWEQELRAHAPPNE